MFQMDPVFAILSIVLMVGLYLVMARNNDEEQDDLASMFQGVLTQATRYLQIKTQRQQRDQSYTGDWRPSVIMVNARTFDRRAPMEFLRWLCQRYGFGNDITWSEDYCYNLFLGVDARGQAECM